MKIKLCLFALLLTAAASVHAQTILKGTVEENGSNTRLSNVFIRDVNNKQLSLADKDGNFVIRTETGHTLIFDSPGYTSDTLYLIDMTPKKIKMSALTIALREVRINSNRTTFNPREEYPEIYEKSKVYVFSPSSWFSKDSKDARRLKRYFATEEQERHIDQVFTRAYVGSLVPLKGKELDDFMTMYRPSYDFLKSNNTASLAVYINDSYKKYMALPPSQRSMQPLSSQ
jgi:hypothetical protein